MAATALDVTAVFAKNDSCCNTCCFQAPLKIFKPDAKKVFRGRERSKNDNKSLYFVHDETMFTPLSS
jgi:hypothetical protein